MQKLKRGIAILITVFILSTVFIVPAYASEITQDGLKAEIILEKDNYSKNEEIPVKIVVTNTNDYDVQNVSIEGVIPKGLTLVNDTATKSADLLQAGATLELTYILKSSDTANNSYKLGDVNDDGDITATDARLALRISAQLEEPTDIQIKASDTDNNGKVTASDARKILRVSAKLDSFKENTKINNKLLISSLNISNTKTGKVSVIPLAVNSAKTIAVKNTSKADISKNIENYLGIILGVCLIAVAICTLVYFLRKNKTHTKRTILSVLCALIVLSTVAGTTLFIAIADNTETTDNLKSFTVSEIVTVDGTDYSINNKVRYDDIDKSLEEQFYVDDRITEVMKSNDYVTAPLNDQKDYIENLLIELKNSGKIRDYSYSERNYLFSIEYSNGESGGVFIKNPYEGNDCYSVSSSVKAYSYRTLDNASNEKIYSKLSSKSNWTFSIGTSDGSDSPNELKNYYSELGVSIQAKQLATPQTYSQFGGSDFVYIQSHGFYDEKSQTPIICTEEVATKEKKKQYKKNGYSKLKYYNFNGTEKFVISPDFIEQIYENNELDGAIIYIGVCEGFGANNIENDAFYESFKKAGADTVIGFCNSVNIGYSNYFAEKLLYYIAQGYTINDSFKQTVTVLGENGNEFWNTYGATDFKESATPARAVFRGETDVTLFKQKLNGLGTFSAIISDYNTKEHIENVAVEIKNKDNKELYHLLKTNSNGIFSIDLPEGDYVCTLIHKDYYRKDFEFSVKKDVETVLLEPIYIKSGTEVSGVVIDKATNTPISNATIEAFDSSSVLIMPNDSYENFKKGKLIATTTTDENGNYSLTLPSGQYALAVTHKDYNFNGVLFSFEHGLDEYMLQDILLTLKGLSDGEDEKKEPSGELGTIDNPYKISTVEDLINIKNRPYACYELINDIDLSGIEWSPILEFSGNLNGNGHFINNLTYSGYKDYFGLFVVNLGEINNIILSNVQININRLGATLSPPRYIYIGVIASKNEGLISNCVIKSGRIQTSIDKEWLNRGGCHGVYAGGIAGENSKGTIENCINSADLNINATYSIYVGGIAGSGGTFNNCLNTGNIECYSRGEGYRKDAANAVFVYCAGISVSGYIADCSSSSKKITATVVHNELFPEEFLKAGAFFISETKKAGTNYALKDTDCWYSVNWPTYSYGGYTEVTSEADVVLTDIYTIKNIWENYEF